MIRNMEEFIILGKKASIPTKKLEASAAPKLLK